MQLYVKNVRQLHELALTLCLVRRSQNPAGEARHKKWVLLESPTVGKLPVELNVLGGFCEPGFV